MIPVVPLYSTLHMEDTDKASQISAEKMKPSEMDVQYAVGCAV